MDICSPKDGYVVAVFPNDPSLHDGALVRANTLVVQMDSDFEDRAEARLQTMAKTRQITAEQFIGDQVATVRKIAQNAIDKSAAKLDLAQKTVPPALAQLNLGLAGSALTLATLRYQVAQADLEHTKAVDQLTQFNDSVVRHVQINDEADKHTALEMAFIEARRARLKIFALKDGHIKLLVAKGSFAQIGSVLFSIS